MYARVKTKNTFQKKRGVSNALEDDGEDHLIFSTFSNFAEVQSAPAADFTANFQKIEDGESSLPAENPACRRVEHLKNVIFDDGLRGARVPHLSQTFGESEGPPSGTLVGGVFFETSKFAVSSCNFCTLTELAPLAHGLASLAGTIQKQTRQDM